MRRAVHALLIVSLASALPPQSALASEGEPYREPLGRAARSLVLPGWGQWSNGEDGKGTVFFVLAAIGVLFGSGAFGLSSTDNGQQFEKTVGWGLYGASTVASVVDAYRVAERVNRENGYDLAAIRPAGMRIPLIHLRFDLPAP